MEITVIGAGLAGCEAAYVAANAGAKVTLIDMKPEKMSPAHEYYGLAELVCSNSLKAKRLESAAGLLKHEMRMFNSVCLQAADKCQVAAGGALAVDRKCFSDNVTDIIKAHENIELLSCEVKQINQIQADAVIIATGPLTSQPFVSDIEKLCGGKLAFFDAAAPIVNAESVDMDYAFIASRYDKSHEQDSAGDYINCPMNKAEYEAFHSQLIKAKRADLHDVDKQDVYEGCMPIEVLAKRGLDSIRYGPMKPVGLTDPKTNRRPWAVVQLRKENIKGDLLNLVGFQTNLTFSEQKRVFGMIPALKSAQYARYGVMHRNTFIDSPKLLGADYRFSKNSKNIGEFACEKTLSYNFLKKSNLWFAGQITGVEGYMESAASGIVAGINAVLRLKNKSPYILPKNTMMGALAGYISDDTVTNFQPMGANMGILPSLEIHVRDKKQRYQALAQRSVDALEKSLNILRY